MIDGVPEAAEFSLMGRAVLVVWSDAEPPRTGETGGWRHIFRIYVKAEPIQAYFRIAKLIVDGVPTGEPDNFLNCNMSDLTDGVPDAELILAHDNTVVGRLYFQFSPTSGKQLTVWYRKCCGRLNEFPNEPMPRICSRAALGDRASIRLTIRSSLGAKPS